MKNADTSVAMNPTVNVDILIVRDSHVLLGMPSDKWLQGKEKLWGIPGDDIQFEETIEEAVRRNLRDELGVTLKSMKILGVHENFAFGNHYIGIGILVDIDGEPDLKPISDNWQTWEWFSFDQLPENLFIAAQKTIGEYQTMKRD